MRKALLIGRHYHLIFSLPQVLVKAGFSVDVVCSNPFMQYSNFIHNCLRIPHEQSIIPTLTQKLKNNYGWIVVTEDKTLQEIVQSSLSTKEKLKVLPVLKEEIFRHLFSKTNLAQIFESQGINSLLFYIVDNIQDALLSTKHLEYPVLLKKKEIWIIHKVELEG